MPADRQNTNGFFPDKAPAVGKGPYDLYGRFQSAFDVSRAKAV